METRSASFSIGGDVSGVSAARRFTRDRLEEWGLGDAVEVAELLVSELVTNALLHAGSSPVLQLLRVDGHVRIEVSDASPAVPTMKDYGDLATVGRGLQLIEALAAQWGVESRRGGKTVWFEVQDPGS